MQTKGAGDLQKPKEMTQSGTYLELPKSDRSPSAKAPLHTNRGHNAGVPVLEKHSLKSGFFQKKVSKGQG